MENIIKNKKLITVAGLAEMLNVSQRAVRDWLFKGKLDHVRINVGRLVRFDQERILKHIDNRNLLDT